MPPNPAPSAAPPSNIRNRTRALQVSAPDATIRVMSTAYGQESNRQSLISVPVFHTEPARVTVAGSVTRNQGDFNSARVEVSISLPCYPNDADIRETKDYASRLLEEMIPAEFTRLQNRSQGH